MDLCYWGFVILGFKRGLVLGVNFVDILYGLNFGLLQKWVLGCFGWFGIVDFVVQGGFFECVRLGF